MLFNFVLYLAFLTFFGFERHWWVFCRRNARMAYILNLVLVSMMSLFSIIIKRRLLSKYASDAVKLIMIISNVVIVIKTLPTYTYLSQIHVFGFDVIFVILIGFCLMLSPFLCVCVCVCVCYILMLCRCSPLVFNAFPSVLVCYPDFVFCPWIYEFWTAVYYCCLYLPIYQCFLNQTLSINLKKKRPTAMGKSSKDTSP